MTKTQFSTQDKIKYLKRYVLLDREIDRKLAECERWRLRLGKITATISDMPGGGGSIHKSTDHDIINRIIDLEREMDDDIDKMLTLKQEIMDLINGISEDRERLLMQLRYLDGQQFEFICGEMGYSWSNVHRLHRRALNKLTMVCHRVLEVNSHTG